ncbi:MAG TPA: hypothetical protein VG432_13350 [Gemmatimonadaceae bacterium]|nr:hypothetical protein [Gemmatimonadaceae bacterium]
MLVSFVRPGGGEAAVGLLSADGGRVADLTAIGMEDVFAALPRAAQLERLVKHLTATPGAVTWDVGSVRLLAPVPYARLVRAAAAVVAGGGDADALTFDDPREIAGPGTHVSFADGELLAVGIVAALGTGGRDIPPAQGVSHLAGVTIFAEWRSADPGAPIASDRLVTGPALATMSALGDDAELLVTMPHESVRRIPLGGARAALGAAVAAASSRYTLQPGDLFLQDAGVVDALLGAGESGEITIDGPSGTLSHVATRSG